MAKDESAELAELQSKWAMGQASRSEIRRCMNLERRKTDVEIHAPKNVAEPKPLVIGEVNCFDSDGMPVIRLYPCAAKAPRGAEVFVLPAYGVSGNDHQTFCTPPPDGTTP